MIEGEDVLGVFCVLLIFVFCVVFFNWVLCLVVFIDCKVDYKFVFVWKKKIKNLKFKMIKICIDW